ncbi:MAG: hypothetical protein WD382_07450 [Halofilum sp. (in: g-proteobacteria)]
MTAPQPLFHVNAGHAFAKPYESYYAMARRCLTANPGVSWGCIQAMLRRTQPAASSIDRLARIQLDSIATPTAAGLALRGLHRRQCPACAGALYHTAVFLLPWLTHCPVHHCALTEHCPQCGCRWPDLAEMERRDCPRCGRLPLHRLVAATQDVGWAIVGEVYRFIAGTGTERYTLGFGRYPFSRPEAAPWWRRPALDHPLFAAFWAPRSRLSGTALDALHIAHPPLQQRRARLTVAPDAASLPGLAGAGQRPVWAPDLRQVHRVMRMIAIWLAHQAPGHRVHIVNYRHLPLAHFARGPRPCPYCLALSLWFFHTVVRRYGPYFSSQFDDYPFCRPLDFIEAVEPHVVRRDGVVLVPDIAFANWLYRRSLEIRFVSLLQAIFDWTGQLENYRDHRDPNAFRAPLRETADGTDRLFEIAVTGDQLTLYYLHEHPLADFRPSRQEGVTARCRRYHRYYACDRSDVVVPFDHEVHDPRLPLKEFEKLLARFENHLCAVLGPRVRADFARPPGQRAHP